MTRDLISKFQPLHLLKPRFRPQLKPRLYSAGGLQMLDKSISIASLAHLL